MSSEQNRFVVEAKPWQTEPAFELRDETSGSRAIVALNEGANCVAWSVATSKGQVVEILETPPSPEDLRERRFRAGIPVLWPFPGRVRNARYQFQGQEHQLPRTDKGGVHHIHGIVNTMPWRVISRGSGAERAKLGLNIGPFDLTEEYREGFPFDFSLSLTFTLKERQLIIDTQVHNSSKKRQSMPFGYGLHPYFRAPLVPSAATPDRSACPVLLPAATRWPTVEGLPTGPAQPVTPEEDFQQWRLLGTQHFDHIYGGATYDKDNWSVAGYRDVGAGLEVRIKADHNFREWVLFTQPKRPSICIEPYTCPPNAINFEEENIPDSGLIVIEPGDLWTAKVILEVVEIA